MISLAGATSVPFVKGHGTGNDFVLLPDLDDHLDLGPEQVRAICDRRRGIGADGVLRVVRTSRFPEAAALADEAEYFMDYRNADGSLAEMCGNGARVFACYLLQAGLLQADRFRIATRAGVHEVRIENGDTGRVAVDLGVASTPVLRAMPVVTAGGRSWPAVGVLMPNPHAVAFVADLEEVGDLREPPVVAPASVFPDGVNVEFVHILSEAHISMRVHERGIGETYACGTGACAAAWATGRRQPGQVPAASVRVDMRGGTVQVSEVAGSMWLTGPADLVAEGRLLLPIRTRGA